MDSGTRLCIAVSEAVSMLVEGPEVGVAFSGGLDSTLLACLASKDLGAAAVRGYVVAVGEGAHDLGAAREAARTTGIHLEEILVSEGEVAAEARELSRTIGTEDEFVLSFELPLWYVASRAREKDILLGQGADELFGGYARYRRMDPETLAKALREDAEGLYAVVAREEKIARRFGKEFLYPYLDREVVALASALPVAEKVGPRGRKLVLQEAAIKAGLPEPLSRKAKKAAQYGSGTWRVLRKGAGATPRQGEGE